MYKDIHHNYNKKKSTKILKSNEVFTYTAKSPYNTNI